MLTTSVDVLTDPAEAECFDVVIGALIDLPSDDRARVITASRTMFGLDGAKRSRNRFRERELARAVRAAKCAGGERVEIDPATGKISVIIAKPDNEAATNNALDQWLKDKNARPS
jgi:hypothetical protein